MNAVDVIKRLHQHRMWVNHHLLDAAAGLNSEQLHRSFEMGQGSLWRTLTHLYAAEYVWLAALQGHDNVLNPGDVAGALPGNQQGEGAVKTLDELHARWSELDARWQKYLAGLTVEALDELVYRTSVAFKQTLATRRSDSLLHVCTHA